MENNLSISRENALSAYENADEKGRQLLEHLFGKEVFEKDDITARVKYFGDACLELGREHPFVMLYDKYLYELEAYKDIEDNKDVLTYVMLRIIVAALNEGWEANFAEDEKRYFPVFGWFSCDEFMGMSDEEKHHVVVYEVDGGCRYFGFRGTHTQEVGVDWHCYFAHRLAFKTRELAEYAGRKFTYLYADYAFSRP